MSEAAAEIEKSIEVTEFACSAPQLAAGEIMEVSKGVECRMRPVSARSCCKHHAIQFPKHGAELDDPQCAGRREYADTETVGTGSFSACRIADLLHEAGLPDGVFNIVHGSPGDRRGDMRPSGE